MRYQKLPAGICRPLWGAGALALLVSASPAISQTAVDKSPPVTSHSSMDKKDAMKAGTPGMAGRADMRGSMMGMMKDLESMKMTGNTDRDFAMMMKMHHQGAINMAQMELQSGKDAKMRAMAKRIVGAQQKEIKEFDEWLAKQK